MGMLNNGDGNVYPYRPPDAAGMVLNARTAGHSLEETMKAWIVELEPGVWLTDGDGDPSRTLVEDNAKRFFSRRWAKMALTNARKFRRKFINARIYTPNPKIDGRGTL